MNVYEIERVGSANLVLLQEKTKFGIFNAEDKTDGVVFQCLDEKVAESVFEMFKEALSNKAE